MFQSGFQPVQGSSPGEQVCLLRSKESETVMGESVIGLFMVSLPVPQSTAPGAAAVLGSLGSRASPVHLHCSSPAQPGASETCRDTAPAC